MNRAKMTFIFLTGVLFAHLLGHIWFQMEGLFPFTSKILDVTIMPNGNLTIIGVNAVLLLVSAYFGFLYDWNAPPTAERRHA